MKKIWLCCGVLLCVMLCSCGTPQEEDLPVQNDQFEFVSQEDYMFSAEITQIETVPEEESEPVREALSHALGSVDSETGFPHIFLIKGKVSLSDGKYYWCSWGWIEEEDGQQKTTMIEEFIISEDLQRAYSASYDADTSKLTWYTNYNWLN